MLTSGNYFNTLRIGLDFDDVIVDTISAKDTYLANALGVNYLEDPEYLVTKRKFYSDIEASLDLLKPLPDAAEVISRLCIYGHEIRIVTARGSESELLIPQTILVRLQLNIPVFGVGYQNNKLSYLKGFNIFMDDDPKNLKTLEEEIPNLYLMSTQENIKLVTNCIRVSSWLEFEELVLKES